MEIWNEVVVSKTSESFPLLMDIYIYLFLRIVIHLFCAIKKLKSAIVSPKKISRSRNEYYLSLKAPKKILKVARKTIQPRSTTLSKAEWRSWSF